ncbi:MAG: gliding motility-associated C-terminal domain-containing protein [Bacteroidales bacterium]
MKLKKLFISIILIFSITNVIAQTYLMPTSGYQEIHTDSGVLYDDGGATGNYSTRVSSTMTIYPATPGSYVCLRGSIDLEDYMFSSIRIYDGDTNSTWEVAHLYSGNSNVNIVSYSGALTIRFFVDTETPQSGFEFNITAPIYKATNVNPTISNNNSTVNFTWDGTTSEYWIVELSFENQSWIKTTNSNSITFDSLPYSCCYYNYLIYTPSDSIDLPCYRHDWFYIGSAYSVSNVRYDLRCDTLEVWWDSSDTTLTWKVEYDNSVTLNPDPPGWYTNQIVTGFANTNHIVLHIPKYTANYLYNYDVYRSQSEIRIYGSDDGSRYCHMFGVGIEPVCCCPRAKNLYISDLESYYATISWDADTNSEGWIVEYNNSVYPDDSISFLTVNTNSVTLTNLSPASKYDVRIHSLCDSLVSTCSSKINVITNISGIDNCMSFTNLQDTNFTPYTGTYTNPHQNFGLIGYGYKNQHSRHTVHYDTTEFDPRTDSLLRTVPLGEEASVRLGNWLPGAQGESFTYAYDVDTNVFDLMYLRYAVVMENPGHTMENQPRFTLEILNDNDSLIDPVCGFADFFASDSLGWHTVSNSIAIWKDWTLVGFDITPYHGQRIYVRLTTRDCDEGGHYGYAYYHLTCGSKNLISTKCGYVDSNTFIAPIGFNYNWYSSNNPSLSLSTERILDAVVDSTVNYHCLVSSTENPSCSFLYTAYGGYRYPLSLLDYDYTWQPCSYTVNFNNLSTISPDGISPAGTGERCETAMWIFSDGDTITSLNATKTFSDTTEIKVRLISGIANDQCVDILDTVINLNRPYSPLTIIGDNVLCLGDTAILSTNLSGNHFWSNGETTSTTSFIPFVNATYSLELIDSLGCYNIDSIYISINPRDTIHISAEICDNETYTLNGFNTNVAGIHEQLLISEYNCDSVVYLNLTVYPTYNDTIFAEICQEEVYRSDGFEENETGFYTITLPSIHGCDSVVNLDLLVHPIYNDTIYASICNGEIYSLNEFNENVTGIYTKNLLTTEGCDSIVNLNLIVHPIYNDTIDADICNGDTYSLYQFNEYETGLYTKNLQTIDGCDSIVTLNLVVHPTYLFDTIDEVICKNNPFTEHGLNIDSNGVYIANLQTIYGCDSIYTVKIEVNPVYYDTIRADIYKGNTYNQHGFNENTTGVYNLDLQTYLGCDSIIYLDLQVDNVLFPNVVTPNGDGINDVFTLNNLVEQDAFPENELIILNRQGKIIYRKINIKSKIDFWDPELTKSPSGTYFYRFKGTRHDKTIDVTSSVEVLR